MGQYRQLISFLREFDVLTDKELIELNRKLVSGVDTLILTSQHTDIVRAEGHIYIAIAQEMIACQRIVIAAMLSRVTQNELNRSRNVRN